MIHGQNNIKFFQPKLLIVLLYVFFVCVNVYCTTATRCQPNCS